MNLSSPAGLPRLPHSVIMRQAAYALCALLCLFARSASADDKPPPAKSGELDVTLQIIVDPDARLPDEVVRKIPLPRAPAPKIPAGQEQAPGPNESAAKGQERAAEARERGREMSENAKERAREAAQKREESRREQRGERPQPPERPTRPPGS